ncbi:MAG: autotransporter domain-containing protein [Pseudomonadota bacterium]
MANPSIRKTLLIAASALSISVGSNALAQDYDGLVVFGDSLSDPGNIFPGFRSSNGIVYAEYLPDLLNIDEANVSNFAFGGAMTRQLALASGTVTGNVTGLAFLADTDMNTQLESFFAEATGRISPSAVYIVNGGGNNGFAANGVAAISSTPDMVLTDGALDAAADIISQSSRLIAAGARTVAIPNLVNLGAVPEPLGFGTPQEATSRVRLTEFTAQFNEALTPAAADLAETTGTDIVLVDANSFLADVQADPSKYGFVNASVACTSTPSCASADLASQNTFFFWDEVHPTTQGHAVTAAFFADTLFSPFVLAGVGETLRDSSEARRQRFATMTLADLGDENGFFVFVDGGYLDLNRDAGTGVFGYTVDGWDIGGGVGKVLSNRWAAAVYGGFSEFDGAYETIAAGFNSETIYIGALLQGQLPIGAVLTGDVSLGFSDIGSSRDTGVANQVARADQDATTIAASARLSKSIALPGFTLIPEAAVGYFRAGLDEFSQSGATGLDLAVSENNADAFYGEVGARIEKSISFPGAARLTPRARAVFRMDFDEFNQTIETSLVSAPGVPRTVFVDGYADGSLRLEGGLRLEAFDIVDVDISGGGLVARDESSGYFLSGRVSVSF